MSEKLIFFVQIIFHCQFQFMLAIVFSSMNKVCKSDNVTHKLHSMYLLLYNDVIPQTIHILYVLFCSRSV